MRQASLPKGANWLVRKPPGAGGWLLGESWLGGRPESGVLIGELKHGARLLQALVHVQPPPERLLLLLQLSADTPRAGDRLLFAFGMENGSTAFTPAC